MQRALEARTVSDAVGAEGVAGAQGADPDPGHGDRGPAALAADHPGDPGLAHQPFHALAGNALAIGEHQLGVDPG